jgi:hypothetical protein
MTIAAAFMSADRSGRRRMKITVEMDCTPEEARSFLGLPDVRPTQEKMMRQLEDRMSASLQAMDPQEMARQWLAPNLKGLEAMLEAFARMSGTK